MAANILRFGQDWTGSTCGGSRANGPHGRSVRLGAGDSSDARFGPPRSTKHYAGQYCPPHSPERFTSHDI